VIMAKMSLLGKNPRMIEIRIASSANRLLALALIATRRLSSSSYRRRNSSKAHLIDSNSVRSGASEFVSWFWLFILCHILNIWPIGHFAHAAFISILGAFWMSVVPLHFGQSSESTLRMCSRIN